MLKTYGFSNYQINKLTDEKKLLKLNKKMYENLEYKGDEIDFYYVDAYVSNGVVCLMSAAVYYNLSTHRPSFIDVAINRKAKVSSLPKWPDIRLHFFTDFRFENGIEIINNDGNTFKIYDIEKTVCDIVFYKNMVGVEETKEILTNYLNREDRKLNKLIRYAKDLKCEDKLNAYLEVLL